jgi:hypothetical protein
MGTTVQVTELGPSALHALEHIGHDLTEIRIAVDRIAAALAAQASTIE